MRPCLSFVVAAVLVSTTALAELRHDPSLFDGAARVSRAVDGAVKDVWNVALPASSAPRAAADALLEREALTLFGTSRVELRLAAERESLAGRHLLYAQSIGGVAILNGVVSVSIARDGSLVALHNRTARGRASRETFGRASVSDAEARVVARNASHHLGATSPEDVRLVGWIGSDGGARPYRRVVLRRGELRWAVFVDAITAEVGWIEPLFFTAKGQVFNPNPVAALDQVALRDNDDSASTIPGNAYESVELPGFDSTGSLAGPNATIVDLEAPATRRAQKGAELVFDRSQDEFEDVMAYVHVDREQRYLQSLGFTGTRAIVPYSIEIDAHGGAIDNSSYRMLGGGRGRLFFGDGGVDDAEDADVILHELGHAIQDSIVPDGFGGPPGRETRALGEGFADYLAFSARWPVARASGRDPYCIADWDVRCGDGPSSSCGYKPGADCLRRVDGTRTMADYESGGDAGGEHRNGEIWSSALRELFVAAVGLLGDVEGRRVADRTILESHFGLPPFPDFRTSALRILDADRRLNHGLLRVVICNAMTSRGIIAPQDCADELRGDLTLFEAPTRDVPIPDNDRIGISSTLTVTDTRKIEAIYVRVDVEHPRRGEIRLTLISPTGAEFVLMGESSDSGDRLCATFGRDTEPSQPLTPLVGQSAAGAWTLRVTDAFSLERGRLASWGLMLRLSGDSPATSRPESSSAIAIPVSGSVAGAFGARFVSDVRVLNLGTTDARVSLMFTPSGSDGSTAYSAINLVIPRGQVTALDDVVGSVFREGGTGWIEIRGETAKLLVSSRVYTDGPAGTFGQFVPTRGSTGGKDDTLHVLHLSNDDATRSNLGITEVGGAGGRVEVRLFDAHGAQLETMTVDVAPFSHRQWPLLGGLSGARAKSFRAEVRVSSGDARIVAYGSAVDNASGDAIFIPGTDLMPAAPGDALIVPAVVRANGANGTRWRSDVRIMAPAGAGTSRVRLTLRQTGLPARSSEIEIAPGALAELDDVVASVFGLESGRGTLEIESLGGDASVGLVVTSRTWTTGAVGTFGQFVPARKLEDARVKANGQASLVHIDSTAAFRCNVGLAEVSGSAATVRVRLLDASGVERFAKDVVLQPYANEQFALADAGAPAIANGRIVVEIIEGNGRVLAYASVVDNRTGDPIFIPL